MNIRFKQLANLALASFGLITFFSSIVPIAATIPKATALPAALIAANEPDLLGSWRATDEAVREMYAKVYQGNPPDEVAGDILLVFEDTAELELIYDDVNLSSDGVPPVTMNGEMAFTWQIPNANVLQMNPQSYDFKVETLGISMPVPENIVPSVESSYGYEIEENILRLTTVPEGIYIPLEWKKL